VFVIRFLSDLLTPAGVNRRPASAGVDATLGSYSCWIWTVRSALSRKPTV